MFSIVHWVYNLVFSLENDKKHLVTWVYMRMKQNWVNWIWITGYDLI